MTLKTPSFWYPKEGQDTRLTEALLTPLSHVYGFFYKLDHLKKPKKHDVPVICIGNILAGGTGKTPTALAVMNLIKLEELAKNPFFLTRGYGGAEQGPLMVSTDAHSSWDVGDEAIILSKYAPTVVSADRSEGAAFAKAQGADLIVMDDGLQNPSIHKDLKLIVVNGEMGFGNKKMLPAGPLRQPMQKGLNDADGFIFIGEDKRGVREILPKDKPVIDANIVARNSYNADENSKYLAFAGLGYPRKFFNFLRRDMGLNVVKTLQFADHCPYEEADIIALHKKAQELGATLITTEKDLIRLPKIEGIDIQVMPVKMVIEDKDALAALISTAKTA